MTILIAKKKKKLKKQSKRLIKTCAWIYFEDDLFFV